MDKNFDLALNLLESEHSHEDLINYLKCGTLVERHYAALHLSQLCDKPEALIFISNLIEQDGKVREAVSFKFKEFLTQNRHIDLFKTPKTYEILSKSVIDINSNVCRNILEVLPKLSTDEEFIKIFPEKIENIIRETFDEIEKITFRDKKYKLNKQLFKLYWCLESMYILHKCFRKDFLKETILHSAKLQEYTIREKGAFLIKKLTQFLTAEELELLNKKYSNDENFYVQEIFN